MDELNKHENSKIDVNQVTEPMSWILMQTKGKCHEGWN